MIGWREQSAVVYIFRHVCSNTSGHGTRAFRSTVRRAETRPGDPQEISHRRGARSHFRNQSTVDRHARALRQGEAARPSAHRGGRSTIPLFTGWRKVPRIYRDASSRSGASTAESGSSSKPSNSNSSANSSSPSRADKPSRPREPTRRDRPITSNEPDKRTRPEQSSRPSNSSKPREPTRRDSPITPSEPDRPDKPDKPSRPDSPSSPEQPAKSNGSKPRPTEQPHGRSRRPISTSASASTSTVASASTVTSTSTTRAARTKRTAHQASKKNSQNSSICTLREKQVCSHLRGAAYFHGASAVAMGADGPISQT